MLLCDYHMHSRFSFDGEAHSTPDALCKKAIEAGFSDIAITDHCDVNGEVEGIYPKFDAEGAYAAMVEAKEKYKGRLNVLCGVELGNAMQYPEYAKSVLAARKYDFVIGSLHNLRGVPDFSCIDFSRMFDTVIFSLFDRALDEQIEMCNFPIPFSTVGHITYMHRYVTLCGRKLDMKPYLPKIEQLYKTIIDRDMALEINVSTLWKGLGISMPTLELLKFYRDCGGRLITIGSDAHCPENLGKCIRQGYALLEAAGFDSIMLIRDGERTLQKFN